MGIINNKWFQAFIVLVIANFFTPLGDSAVGAVGFIGMLIVFVPKFREMAKLDNIVNVNEASKQSKSKAVNTNSDTEMAKTNSSQDVKKEKKGEDESFSKSIDEEKVKTDSTSQTVKQLILEVVDVTLKDFFSSPPREAYSSGDGYFEWEINVFNSNNDALYEGKVECCISTLEDVIMNEESPSLVEDDVRESFKDYLHNSEQAILYESSEQVDLQNSKLQVNVYEVVDGGNDQWVYYSKNHYFDAVNNADGDTCEDNSAAINKMKKDPWDFRDLNDAMKADKEVAMIAVTDYGSNLEYVSESLKSDKEVVMAAVSNWGDVLEHASDSLKADKEVVLAALKSSGGSIEFASDDLKLDPEIYTLGLRSGALECLPDKFKSDKEFVFGAVTLNGENLQYVAEELKADKDVVKAAIKNNSHAMKYASEDLRADKELVLEAMRSGGVEFDYLDKKFRADKEVVLECLKHNQYFSDVSDDLKADKDVVRAAIKAAGYSMEDVSEALKADKEFMLEMCKLNSDGFEYLSENLKSDKSFILSIIQSNYYAYNAYQYISENLKDDRDFAIEAIKANAECFEYIAGAFKDDKKIVLEYISNIKNKDSCEIPEKYRIDKDVITADLKNQGTLLKEALEAGININNEIFFSIIDRKVSYLKSSGILGHPNTLYPYLGYGVPAELRANKEFMMHAIQYDYTVVSHASSELLNDKDFLYAAIKSGKAETTSTFTFERNIPDTLKADKGFMLSAAKLFPDILSIASDEVKADHAIAEYWVNNGTNWLDEDVNTYEEYKANKDLVLQIMKKRGWLLQDVSQDFKADKEVVMAAVKQDCQALEYASSELKADKEVVLAALETAAQNDFDKKDVIIHASWSLLTDIDFILSI